LIVVRRAHRRQRKSGRGYTGFIVVRIGFAHTRGSVNQHPVAHETGLGIVGLVPEVVEGGLDDLVGDGLVHGHNYRSGAGAASRGYIIAECVLA